MQSEVTLKGDVFVLAGDRIRRLTPSKTVGKFLVGTNVDAITGEVRTVRDKFVILKKHEENTNREICYGSIHLTSMFNYSYYNIGTR